MSSVRANVVDSLLRRRPPEVSCMNESTRPKRVVVVDAENPLVEISGEFYWLEDHERIVAQARGTESLDTRDAGLDWWATRR
jgi:hypothetical protein